MKRIFLAGAGKSTSWLIKYLSEQSVLNGWKIVVGDYNLSIAKSSIANCKNSTCIKFNVFDDNDVVDAVNNADIIISMLPATIETKDKISYPHVILAKKCIAYKKHLVTASYISDSMNDLHEEAVQNGVLLLNEIGLDPGIDHMSLMQDVDQLRDKHTITSLKSYCGGLIAPQSNDNPWGYKFTWNVRNVIHAGKSKDDKPAIYQKDKQLVKKYYSELFSSHHTINYKDITFDGYANRDSIKYKSIYKLENINTIFRGTLRYAGYCKGWDALIKLGLTRDDDHGIVESAVNLQRVVKKLNPSISKVDKNTIAAFLKINTDSTTIEKLDWLGLFSRDELIDVSDARCKTYADVLQSLLMVKWKLHSDDKDLVVMLNEIKYKDSNDDKNKWIISSLFETGENNELTAMAKTVGLPLAIATKLILGGKTTITGVQRPIHAELYNPILEELESYGVVFERKVGED